MQRIVVGFIFACMATFGVVQYAAAQSFGVQGQLKPQDGVLYNTITMDCTAVKAKLVKVHESDGLTRVNAGQLYDSVANKLMARLNSKIAEQRLDGGKLFTYAAAFERHLSAFRDTYRSYESAMTQLIKSDCHAYPQNFYYLLDAVRQKRQQVQQEVTALYDTARAYKQEAQQFAERLKRVEVIRED